MATIDMDDIYPDNSNHQYKGMQQSQEPKPKPDVIVIRDEDVTIEDADGRPARKENAIVKIVKKSPRVYNALKYGVDRIIVPACLSTLHRFLYSLVDFMIYESPRGKAWSDRNNSRDYNSLYRDDDPFSDKYSDNSDTYIYERPYRTSRNEQFGLHKIGFATRDSAAHCLNELRSQIDMYGKVSLDYFFHYINREPPTRMCGQWGWVSLNDVSIVPVAKGFRIKFPEVINIK